MILSHAHRFIFIKTPKSAGTSIELALAPLCGADDVITPILETTTEARNYLRGPPPLRYDRDYYNHMRLQQVAKHAGRETAARYFKFAFVRNPWDRQVSQYFWRKHRGLKVDLPFTEWVMAMKPMLVLPLLRLDGEMAMDFVGRFETLEHDFRGICQRIGLEAPALPREKSGLRPEGHYRDHYDAKARERVARMYAAEIALFGYSF